MRIGAFSGAILGLCCLVTSAAAQDRPVLEAAVLEFGTVNWELTTIRENGLDEARGFDLEVRGVASGSAGEIAFQGGAVDVIVSDWLWVARQRAAGKDFVFIPYSTAVGGVMVAGDSPAETLADLAGGKIGIAGGPLDKSWLIVQAYARQVLDMDLVAETEQVFGAPPLIYKTATSGELDGAINYWHYMAKMEAAGMRKLVDIADAAEALGLDPDTPLLGYVVKGELVRENPDLIRGLAAASRDAKALLAEDDAAWDALRPAMNAENDAEFEALKQGFLAGVPKPGPVDEEEVDKMLRFMAESGGDALVGDADSLPEGTFFDPAS
ncbi:ABC transporter substrate-binding protein [Roseivivax halodurans JCM 10272]|uniref:ABC transporter substrate-binding protein n=2 Tax=Roseivivax halodurans TaxID=93683 RepID=X7EG79_9RHOB|nr:ABC transporter substrate-binding protein [Roseivivax halodurans]ETX14246.1 ABC transporter substrate-binding protein [Roseivivax halodurans JCM 10272]